MLMDMRNDQRQTQTLSPRLQHAVRLLQMSSLDFGALVREALDKNPFLEAEENEHEHEIPEGLNAASAYDDSGSDGEEKSSISSSDDAPETAANEGDFDNDSGSDNDRDLWQADGSSGVRKAEDSEISAMDMMMVETTLNTHLHGQLNVLPLSHRDLMLVRTIVESLDDDGYLRTPLSELLELAGLDPIPTESEMQVALKHVQALEPAGVGARTVAECLELQVPSIECPELRLLAQKIITEHLDLLAGRDVTGLARKLGVSPTQVEAACDRIRRLDPRPGWRLGSTHVQYVVPDVLVKKVRGEWTVQLNPAIVPKVRLNQVYADLFQRHRTAQNTEMGTQLQEAKWTLRNVDQRFSTILDVAEAIVRRQKHFLDFGTMAMKPLGLREIADEVGVHESTVSRVTNNKYMSTPMGVFELKYFFSRAMVSANGSACSGTAIRGLIKDIIEAEKPESPLSDAEITRQLGQQGLVVARRTVTKYRQMLRIEAVDRRRRQVA
jgi:RNA polymerase sigma-54 factor